MSVRVRFLLMFMVGATVSFLAFAGIIGAGFFGGSLEFSETASWKSMTLSLLACLGVIALAALVVRLWLAPRYGEPVDRILVAIEQLTTGNLDPDLPEGAPAEFGEISRALKMMSGQLRMVMSQLSTLSSRVVEATDGAGVSFGEVSAGAKQQSQSAAKSFNAIDNLGSSLLEVLKDIESIAKRIDDNATGVSRMDSAIGRISETAKGLSTAVEQAAQTTKEGDKSARVLSTDLATLNTSVATAQVALHDMVDGAQKARNDARDAADVMSRLEAETARIGSAIEDVITGTDAVHMSNERILGVTESLASRVDKVDHVIEVIGNLAERTKLLSINASIIASEAGEHGRAFAVVATEVKDLAGSTAGAISEISKVVGSLKEGFDQTVETIQKGQGDIDHGVQMAKNAVVLLRTLPEVVHKAALRNSEIVQRTERQVEKGALVEEIIEKVAPTLTQVAQLLKEQVMRNERTLSLFQNIRTTSERVSGSARDHAKVAGEINRSIDRMSDDIKGISGRMRNVVSRLDGAVQLADGVLQNTDKNRRRAEDLSGIIANLNRYALYLGEDFRKLGS